MWSVMFSAMADEFSKIAELPPGFRPAVVAHTGAQRPNLLGNAAKRFATKPTAGPGFISRLGKGILKAVKLASADEASAIGHLVNADVGKNQFPDVDVSGKNQEKRQHRGFQYPSTTMSSPDPEEMTPEGAPGYGGFTYD